MITGEQETKNENVRCGSLTFQRKTGIELLLALHVHLKVPRMHSLDALILCETSERARDLLVDCLSLAYHHVIVQGHLVAHLLA